MPLLEGLDFSELSEALAALGVDAWLLYDFRRVNPVAERILGPTGMGTRRLFIFLPRSGKPVAVAHRIELQPLADFPGEVRPYGSWRELHDELRGGRRREPAPPLRGVRPRGPHSGPAPRSQAPAVQGGLGRRARRPRPARGRRL